MLKMFSTQLAGLFKRIQDQELSIEEGARLLAQAAAGDGFVYIYGNSEMRAVLSEAIEGAEPFKKAKKWKGAAEIDSIKDMDRVLVFSRLSTDEDSVRCAKMLADRRVPFVAVSTAVAGATDDLTALADIHIDLKLVKPLLPDEEGNRFGYPSAMAALFAYYGLKFIYEEILAEYEL
ncbi:DUF2529 family protein [Bacillus canaveralius]|uniref:DUF2529 family protein n=1 Tax=Bacillus canaveralius TaxID=1403243 RepID=UPI000F77A544|nr:DUF2529 family protein [Bacillus canaveralius]RSK57522.1 DUF2529 family protein [Bacillus canaveralius]